MEYLARQGLQSKSIFASIKSPSLAAETSRSPEAEHPNELPISPSHPLSLSLSKYMCKYGKEDNLGQPSWNITQLPKSEL